MGKVMTDSRASTELFTPNSSPRPYECAARLTRIEADVGAQEAVDLPPAPRMPRSSDTGNDSGARGEFAATRTRNRQHQLADLRVGGEGQGGETRRVFDAYSRKVRRAVVAGNRSLHAAAVGKKDADFVGPSHEMAGGDDNAGPPMNAAGGDPMASIDGDDGLSCLLGERGCVVGDGFPDFVGGATHCSLLMHRILLQVQAWHHGRERTSGEWAGKGLEGWAGTTGRRPGDDGTANLSSSPALVFIRFLALRSDKCICLQSRISQKSM